LDERAQRKASEEVSKKAQLIRSRLKPNSSRKRKAKWQKARAQFSRKQNIKGVSHIRLSSE
jgi:hypothetical protein